MSFLNADERDARQAQQLAALGPLTERAGDPAAFEGIGDATVKGVGRGLVGLYAGASAAAEYSPIGLMQEPIANLLGTTESLRDSERKFDQLIANAMDATRLDPSTTGVAGSITYGLGAVVVPGAIGTALGGPALGAVFAGGAGGAGSYYDLTAQGVDPSAALGGAAIEGVTTGVGFLLPASLGLGTLTRIGTGAGMNVGLGMGERAAMSSYLEGQGYADIAEQYKVFDGLAIGIDAVLGAAFGALPAHGTRPSQGQIDAALTSNAVLQAETGFAIPANDVARAANIRAQERATEQLLRGEQVTAHVDESSLLLRPTAPEFSDQAIAQAFRDSGLSGLLDEVDALEGELARRGRALGDEPLPDLPGERRSDVAELDRLKELRAERAARRLLPDEVDELLALEDRDRKAAKVAGRRIPGVLNMEARNELEAAGQLLPVQAFADADNFKRVNDELGHDVGDHVIAQMGRLFAEALGDGNVFHRGGDEFVMQARTPGEMRKAMETVRAALEESELVATRADGSTVSRRGVRFSYGEGKTVQEAEHAQYADKEARKRAGLRTDRADAAAPADGGRAGESVGDEGLADSPGGTETAESKDPGEQLIERQVEAVLTERPDLEIPAGIVTQTVFHGTPHSFDRFSLAAMGSGEGAQAYGWGMYFAGDKAVAEHYRTGLTARDFINAAREAYDEFDDPETAVAALREIDGLSQAQKELIDALSADGWLGFDYPHQAIAEALRRPGDWELSPATVAALARQGSLYKTNIPADSRLLDWDKPLSEQSAKVREAIMSSPIMGRNSPGWDGAPAGMADRTIGSRTGEQIYLDLVARLGTDQRAASEHLRSLGLPGLRFLDGNSRKGGEGSANYVIWDEDAIGAPTAADAIAAADQMIDQANKDAPGFMAAVDCFLRRGA